MMPPAFAFSGSLDPEWRCGEYDIACSRKGGELFYFLEEQLFIFCASVS
jgi:hypothetical protein